MIAKNKRKCLHEYSDELIRECEGFLNCENGRWNIHGSWIKLIPQKIAKYHPQKMVVKYNFKINYLN